MLRRLRNLGVAGTVAAVAVLFLGTPAIAADAELDVPVYVGSGVLPPPDATNAGVQACRTLQYRGPGPIYQPVSSHICVFREGNSVWGYVDIDAPAYGYYTQDVYFDLYVLRCRLSDGVCVKISSIYSHEYTNSRGFAHVESAKTSQTWEEREYRACASMSSSLGVGYSTKCTTDIV